MSLDQWKKVRERVFFREEFAILSYGFTLIELSIVLVIIGLIVGGVLVGKDLIEAAKVRAQISQLEKYQTAVNTFKLKYNGLPGDIKNWQQFGFVTRTGVPGSGNGNGIIEGCWGGPCVLSSTPILFAAGETLGFWRDLGDADLVGRKFYGDYTGSGLGWTMTRTQIDQRFPFADIGNYNYLYVVTDTANNYFGISVIANVVPGYGGQFNPQTSITVSQAYSLDNKIDNGLPQSGSVTARVVYSNTIEWVIGGWPVAEGGGPPSRGAAPGNAASPTSLTCYDNGNNASATMVYSLSVASGAGQNCALLIKMR